MYLAYEPRGSIQGLPPLKDSVCVQWVRGVIDNGTNIVAVAAEKSVLGHVALFPVSELVSELLVVVTPSHQNIGIGTELTRSCLEVACELGYERMCLPVDSTNMRARHVYVKCGFAYVSDKLAREIDMTCDLKRVGTVGGRPG